MGRISAWLARADQRNQATADFLRNHPEAGTEMFPGARSRSARWIMAVPIVGTVGVTLAGTIAFGALVGMPLGFCAGLVLGLPLRRYERYLVQDEYAAELRLLKKKRRGAGK